MIAVEKVPAASLFVTDEFRGSEWVAGVVRDLEVWVTRDPVPPGHFGTYFGALTARKYDNAHIQDLYHLHECVHVRTMGHDPSHSWLAWSRRMIRSEFEASVATECTAYARIPELRPKTFAHEIWFDRFAAASRNEPPMRFDAIIRGERVRALNQPKYDDFLEHQIWNYCRQNVQWCRIWATGVGYGERAERPAFRVVEEHMASPDRDATHRAWLDEVADAGVPFARQAEAFAEVYKRSNLEFGNHLLLR